MNNDLEMHLEGRCILYCLSVYGDGKLECVNCGFYVETALQMRIVVLQINTTYVEPERHLR